MDRAALKPSQLMLRKTYIQRRSVSTNKALESLASMASLPSVTISFHLFQPEYLRLERGSGVYMFDWRHLKRWGFSESNLPPGWPVEYRIPTAWEQYRWRMVAGIAIIIVQFFLIVVLLVQRKKRRQTEESLRDMMGRLFQSQDEERRRIARASVRRRSHYRVGARRFSLSVTTTSAAPSGLSHCESRGTQ